MDPNEEKNNGERNPESQNRNEKRDKEMLKNVVSNKSGRDLINVTISKDILNALSQAARNATCLDEAALEIDTVNPNKITLDSTLFMLKSKPANDKISKRDAKKKEGFTPKVVGITSIVVDTMSNKVKTGMITINGSIDVPKSGKRIVTLDECIFDNEADARQVAIVLTEIELERATEMRDEAQDAVDFIERQLKDDRF